MRFSNLKDWLSWQEANHPQVIDLGLERIAFVLSRLDLQDLSVPVITVAGTNGKGSTVALLDAIYRAHGYTVGAYTSPHILKYNERISINGQAASDRLICEAFAAIDDARGEISLSYFEFSTLAALLIFQQHPVDIIILEVGLGGRLDAVNILDADVAIVTSIAIDHAEWLGHSREEIAVEKAGIFRAEKPAIVGDPNPPATLVRCAQQLGAHLYRVGLEFNYAKSSRSWAWHSQQGDLQNLPFPNLKGEHQFYNAASVLMAITVMRTRIPISEQAIKQGLERVELKGRFQVLPGEVSVLLDVGHNPQAVQTLYQHLSEHYPNQRVLALFAIMKDKDIESVVKIMQPLVTEWFFAPLDNPRAATPEMLGSVFEQLQIENYHRGFQLFSEAIAAIKAKVKKNDLILIFGSFFLVSAYLQESEQQNLFLPLSGGRADLVFCQGPHAESPNQ